MRTLLKLMARDQGLVTLRRDRHTDTGLTGLVRAVSDERVHLAAVGASGSAEGLYILDIATITAVVSDTEELGERADGLDKDALSYAPKVSLSDWALSARGCIGTFGLVTLFQEATGVTRSWTFRALVDRSPGVIAGQCVTPEGVMDGEVALPAATITRICADSLYERSLAKIMRIQHRGTPRVTHTTDTLITEGHKA